MNINQQPFGLAGSPRRVLRPAATTPSHYAAGPFGAELRPALRASLNGRYAADLRLGLLTERPDLDGVGGRELLHPGYAAQPVELTGRGAGHLTIMRAVLFDLPICPVIAMLGLFDPDGALEAFGALRGYRTAADRPSCFEFPSCQILVKRVKAAR